MNDLELTSTDDLIDELQGRFENVVLVGRKKLSQDEEVDFSGRASEKGLYERKIMCGGTSQDIEVQLGLLNMAAIHLSRKKLNGLEEK